MLKLTLLVFKYKLSDLCAASICFIKNTQRGVFIGNGNIYFHRDMADPAPLLCEPYAYKIPGDVYRIQSNKAVQMPSDVLEYCQTYI